MLRLIRDLLACACACLSDDDADAAEAELRAELPSSLKILKSLGRGAEGAAFLVEETVWLTPEEAQRLAEAEAGEAEAAGAADAEDPVAAAQQRAAAEEASRRRRRPPSGGGRAMFLKARSALGIAGSSGGGGGGAGNALNGRSGGGAGNGGGAPPPSGGAPADPALSTRSVPIAAAAAAAAADGGAALEAAATTTALSPAPRVQKRLWALKAVPRGPDLDVPGMLAEIRNQARLSGHPNIVGLHEVLLTRRHLCLKMDVAAGGRLLDWICDYKPDALGAAKPVAAAAAGDSAGGGQAAAPPAASPPPAPPPKKVAHMPEPLARYFFVQLAHAVAHCHALSVAHRDLKLANVLLDDSSPPTVKLIDFGLSTTPAMVAVRSTSSSSSSSRRRRRHRREGGRAARASSVPGERRERSREAAGAAAGAGQQQGRVAASAAVLARPPSLMDVLRGRSGGVGAHPLQAPPRPRQPLPTIKSIGGRGAAIDSDGDDGASGSEGATSGLASASPAIGSSPRSWVASAFGGTYEPSRHHDGGGGGASSAAGTAPASPSPGGGGNYQHVMPPTTLGAAQAPSSSSAAAAAAAVPPLTLVSPFSSLASGPAAGGSPAASSTTGARPPHLGALRTRGPGDGGGSSCAGGDSPSPRMLPRSNTAVGTPAYLAPELLSSIVKRGQEHQDEYERIVREEEQRRRQQQQQQQQQQQKEATAAAASAPPLAAVVERSDPSAVAPYDPYKVDVWALGCILFAMLTRRFPFSAGATGVADGPDALGALRAQLDAIAAAREPGERGRTHLRPGLWRELGVSPAVADLLDGMLALDPSARLSLAEALAHPWCRGTVPKTGGYAGALRRLAWQGAYRADEAAAAAAATGGGRGLGGGGADGSGKVGSRVVEGYSGELLGGGSSGSRTISGGGSPTWSGGGASPMPPGALGAAAGDGAAEFPREASPSPPHAPGGASPPTRIRRRSTAAGTFHETLTEATAKLCGLAEEQQQQQQQQEHRRRARPLPLPSPALSPECERQLEALVTAAARAQGRGGGARALRWRPQWRTPPPMVADRPAPLELPPTMLGA
jgi:serine/threonine protein kinase